MGSCLALGYQWLCIGDQCCACHDHCSGSRVCYCVIAGGAGVLYAVDRFMEVQKGNIKRMARPVNKAMPNKNAIVLPNSFPPIIIAIPPLKTRFDKNAIRINLHPKEAAMLFCSVILAVDKVMASISVKPDKMETIYNPSFPNLSLTAAERKLITAYNKPKIRSEERRVGKESRTQK